MSVSSVIVILDCNFPSTAIEASTAASAGFILVTHQCATEAEVVDVARDVDGIIVQYAPLTANVIAQLRHCRIIARYGIGVDNVAVPAATSAGIWVTNVPGFCATELAEHTLAYILAFARRLPRLDRSVRAGHWETIRTMGTTRRLGELTLGIVGFGRVGREIAVRARPFGLTVLATAPHTSAETMAGYGVAKTDLDDLLHHSDFVSLNLPLTPDTRHLINATRLALMKPTAYLLNTSRGSIVDEAALVDALRAGRLAGAGLDVLEVEPPRPDNPLLALESVILTPHASYYSDDALRFLQQSVAEEVVRVLRGEAPRNPVNRGLRPRVVE
jgi:D-3-phosphoglycerate dehydrogenase